MSFVTPLSIIGTGFRVFGATRAATARSNKIKAQLVVSKASALAKQDYIQAIQKKNKLTLAMELKYLGERKNITKDVHEFKNHIFDIHEKLANLDILRSETKQLRVAQENYYNYTTRGISGGSGWNEYQHIKQEINKEADFTRIKSSLTAIHGKMANNFDLQTQNLGHIMSEGKIRQSIIDSDMAAVHSISNLKSQITAGSAMAKHNLHASEMHKWGSIVEAGLTGAGIVMKDYYQSAGSNYGKTVEGKGDKNAGGKDGK